MHDAADAGDAGDAKAAAAAARTTGRLNTPWRALPRRLGALACTVLLLAACALPGAGGGSAGPPMPGRRDVLRAVIDTCIDRNAADYCAHCRWPRTDSACTAPGTTGAVRACEDTAEVWAESAQFVVIRDRKMCGCPAAFVHGLAMPRAVVRGVEDARRPEAIWAYAWAAARARISDTPNIALVVNPARQRSQDQLHVHLVRLQADARQRLARQGSARVATLDAVWAVAARQAAGAGLDDYGILVTTHPEGGYAVWVERDSAERAYAQERCR
jgi:CDP-diacylglycerol pyrophosphatase